ncbi:hypothetical protein CsSME_00019046 [Camellia sinensis var. sinensis]
MVFLRTLRSHHFHTLLNPKTLLLPNTSKTLQPNSSTDPFRFPHNSNPNRSAISRQRSPCTFCSRKPLDYPKKSNPLKPRTNPKPMN